MNDGANASNLKGCRELASPSSSSIGPPVISPTVKDLLRPEWPYPRGLKSTQNTCLRQRLITSNAKVPPKLLLAKWLTGVLIYEVLKGRTIRPCKGVVVVEEVVIVGGGV